MLHRQGALYPLVVEQGYKGKAMEAIEVSKGKAMEAIEVSKGKARRP